MIRKEIVFDKDLKEEFNQHISYSGDFDNLMEQTILEKKEKIKSRMIHNGSENSEQEQDMELMRQQLSHLKEMEKVAEIIEEIDEDSEELLCTSVSDSDFKSEINDALIKISDASISLKNTSLGSVEKIKILS